MGLFYILLIVPIVIQHIAIKGHHIGYQKRNKAALAFFFFLLTLLVALRHETVGTDTERYVYYFRKYARMEWQEIGGIATEFGFALINKVISLFSQEAQVYFAVMAVAVTVMVFPTYKRLCVDASLTIVLYCIMSTFFMMFSGIRQMLAVSIGFVAYGYTRRKKLVHFLMTVLLAVTVHSSAFMLLFMYPLYYARITKKWLWVVLPVLAGVFAFNSQVFAILSMILERYTRFEGGISATGAYTMLILFVAFTVFAFLIPEESCLDDETIGLRNFLLLSLAVQIFAPLHTLAMRMNYYYIIFIPLLLPKIIQYRSKRWNQVAVLGRNIMVIFFLVYFFASAYSDGNLKTLPYHFFWETV